MVFRVEGLGFFGFRVQGFRVFRVQGLGFTVFRVQGLGFRDKCCGAEVSLSGMEEVHDRVPRVAEDIAAVAKSCGSRVLAAKLLLSFATGFATPPGSGAVTCINLEPRPQIPKHH